MLYNLVNDKRLHDFHSYFQFQAAESVELDVVRKWVKNNFVTFEV